SEEHTSELQSRFEIVCRLLLEKMKPRATVDCQASSRPERPPTATPALKNANTGTAIPAEKASTRWAKVCDSECCFPYFEIPRVGTVNASTTPALVAWIPYFRISRQLRFTLFPYTTLFR